MVTPDPTTEERVLRPLDVWWQDMLPRGWALPPEALDFDRLPDNRARCRYYGKGTSVWTVVTTAVTPDTEPPPLGFVPCGAVRPDHPGFMCGQRQGHEVESPHVGTREPYQYVLSLSCSTEPL